MQTLRKIIAKFDNFINKKIVFLLFAAISVPLGAIGIGFNSWIPSLLIFAFATLFILSPSKKYSILVLTYLFFLGQFVQTHFSFIGSYFLFLLIFYYLSLFISLRKKIKSIFAKMKIIFITYVLFTAFSLVVSLINISNIKFLSIFSFAIYCFFPIAFIVDEFSIKDFDKIIKFSLALVAVNYVLCYTLFYTPLTRENYLLLVGDDYSYYAGKSFFEIRFSGLFTDQNEMGLVTIIPICFFLFNLIKSKTSFSKNIFSSVFCLTDMFLGLTTGSKSYMICLFLTLILFVILIMHKKLFKLGVIIAGCCLILVTIFLIGGTNLSYTIFNRFLDTSQDSLIDNVTTGRASLWSYYLNDIITNPILLLFGRGTRASYTQMLFGLDKVCHNFYINLLWDYGLIGTFLFIQMIISALLFNKEKIRNISFNNKMRIFLGFGIFLIYAFGLTLTGSIEIFFVTIFTLSSINVHQNENKFIPLNDEKKHIKHVEKTDNQHYYQSIDI